MNILTQLLRHSSAEGARSSVVRPIGWVLASLLVAFVLLCLVSAPTWVLVVVAVLVALTLVLFVLAYIYFMRRDPDALRSETYVLKKLAIEKGMLGDSTVGLIEVPEVDKILGSEAAGGNE